MEYFLYHECHFSLKEGDEVPMDLLARMFEVHAWSMSSMKEGKETTFEVFEEDFK